MQYFCKKKKVLHANCEFIKKKKNAHLEPWLSREELHCSEMMQLFVTVWAMNEIGLLRTII